MPKSIELGRRAALMVTIIKVSNGAMSLSRNSHKIPILLVGKELKEFYRCARWGSNNREVEYYDKDRDERTFVLNPTDSHGLRRRICSCRDVHDYKTTIHKINIDIDHRYLHVRFSTALSITHIRH